MSYRSTASISRSSNVSQISIISLDILVILFVKSLMNDEYSDRKLNMVAGDEVTITGTRMIVGLMKIGALDRWTQGW